MLAWRQNVVKPDLARGLITGMLIVCNGTICLMFLLIYSTVKQNCKAGFKLNLSEDGQYLEVTDVCDVHLHEVSKVYKFNNIN